MVELKSFKAALGRCPRCFRQSFTAMIVLSVLALGLRWFWPGSPSWLVAMAGAGGCALLWLSHMTLFSARAASAVLARHRDDPQMGRREALRTMACGAVLGIALSVVRPAVVQAQVPGCLQDALCDAKNPCSGCTCHYPPNAKVGYCR